MQNYPVRQTKTAKEHILKHLAKYIKKQGILKKLVGDKDKLFSDTIKNLWEFLSYLEDRQIINCNILENKKELSSLLKDLV